ncbi:MAG: hypothetical protein JWQ76_695 [Ramlibacter sp.]|nr:hypothetical protein [Ramlibacter sp.]
MALDWLEFDYSEDAEGIGSFDAMAAAAPAQLPALQAEVVRVLDWAHRGFGAPLAPEEGGDWHYELQAVQEVATPLAVDYAPGRLQLGAGAAGPPRVTLSLTLGGTRGFCEAFRQAFDLA